MSLEVGKSEDNNDTVEESQNDDSGDSHVATSRRW